LTQEITGERGVAVDSEGFDREMAAQRGRAKSARRQVSGDEEAEGLYRDLVAEHGVTTFVGYDTTESTARVLLSTKRPDGKWEVFLDVTPFYAESGGQVGDTGTIVGASGHARVQDTTFAMPGLRRHVCEMLSGAFEVGEEVVARIDVDARNATRRNHTATHVLHHALREVLGEHVKQAGSLVAPDRLRFDFSHYAPLTREEIEQIEQKANAEVLRNERTEAYETTKDEAVASGAIAFFGDKYGDIVRVLRAGSSFEFCGGTHVAATGDIGAIKIVAESSIGSNLRRIEAVTGTNTLNYFGTIQTALQDSSQILGVQPSEMAAAVQRKLDEIKGLQDEVRQLRSVQARSRSRELQAKAVRGVVVERVDGLEPGDLRELALAIREAADVRAVVLGGVSPAGGVALVAAVRQGLGAQAGDLIKEAAKKVGGGGGGKGDIAAAGGKDASALDAALDLARAAASRVMV
jgi:alanyl-tRNA synthetase